MSARMFPTLGVALLVGCASPGAGPDLPADHPANPNAAVAPLPQSSTTLALGPDQRSTPASPNPGGQDAANVHGDAAEPSGEASGHAHHDHQAVEPNDPAKGGAKAAPAATTRAAEGSAVYACPHHPEVVSDKSDQRCPKCNMKLVRQDAPAAAGHGGHP